MAACVAAGQAVLLDFSAGLWVLAFLLFVFRYGPMLAQLTDAEVIVAGGGDSALDWALALRTAYGYAFPDQKRVHIHSSYDQKLSARVLGNSPPSTGLSEGGSFACWENE